MSLSACQEGEVTLESDPVLPPIDKRGLPQLADQLMSELQAEGIAIATCLYPEAEHLLCIVSRGEVAPAAGSLLDINSGISGRCIRENRLLHSYDTKLDPRVDQEVCERMGIRSLAIAPLHRDSQCVGVLEVFSRQPAAFEGPNLIRFAQEAISVASIVPVVTGLKEPAVAEAEQSKDPQETSNPGSSGKDRCEIGRSPETTPQFTFPSLGGTPFGQTQRLARRYLPWLAASAAAIILGFTAPRLISRIHRSATSLQGKPQRSAQAPVSRSESEQPAISPAQPIADADATDDQKASTQKLLTVAKAGDAMAQFFLAIHYLNGSGVARDNVRAAAWYIMAAYNGNQAAKQAAVEITRKLTRSEIADTRFQVGKMYVDGVGTSSDPVAAYSWFALAKAAGDQRAAKALQELSGTMTREQLSQARLRASNWLTSHGIKSQISENQIIPNTVSAR